MQNIDKKEENQIRSDLKMNKKVLLLIFLCLISIFAVFVSAGDTACGIGGCAPTELASTNASTQVINLVQQGTLTINTLTLTVICNSSATCFNSTNITQYVVCNATNGMYCDSPAKSWEYLNQQMNHTNMTNITKVVVKTGSVVAAVIGDDTVLGGGTVLLTSGSDKAGTNAGAKITVNPPDVVEDVLIDELDPGAGQAPGTYKVFVLKRNPITGKLTTLIFMYFPNTNLVYQVNEIDLNIVSPLPGARFEPPPKPRFKWEPANYGKVIIVDYPSTSPIEYSNGAAIIGYDEATNAPLFGRSLSAAGGTTKLDIAGVFMSQDAAIEEEAGTEYTKAFIVGTVNRIADGDEEIFTAWTYTDGVMNTAPITWGPVVGGASVRELVEKHTGSINLAGAGIYTDPVNNKYAMAAKFKFENDGSVDIDAKQVTGAIGQIDSLETFAIMGNPDTTPGGSHIYQGYAGSDGEDKILVWDSLFSNIVQAWTTSGNDGSSTAVNALRAINDASEKINPAVYVSLFNQSWNNNVGTRVIVLEGSSFATAFKIYNFTADSGSALAWQSTGGHAGDYLTYVLGGRFPEKTNSSAWLDYFNVSLGLDATNPNGTTRFTTDKVVRIQTFAPDINILNFQLDFQNFNGTFDTTLGTCANCSFDGANIGWCQAEVEKVWGMFESYNLTINLSTNDVLNMTSLLLVCRSFNETVQLNSNCSGLSPYVDTTPGCFTPGPATAGYSRVVGNALVVDLINMSNSSIDIRLGKLQPDVTCEQIACELTGTWSVGDPTQSFVINKSITATAN